MDAASPPVKEKCEYTSSVPAVASARRFGAPGNGFFTDTSGFTSPDDTCLGKDSIRLARAHVDKNLLILKHLDPPIGRGHLLHKKWTG